MKKYLFIFFTLFSINSFCQNLTFEELKYLNTLNMESSEQYLLNKDWEFNGSESDIKTNETVLEFAYKRSNSSFGDKAQAFIAHYFSNYDQSSTSVYMQFHNKDKYKSYLSKLKSYSYKLVESRVEEDGSFMKIYDNQKGGIIMISIDSKKDNFGKSYTKYYMTIFKLY